MGEVLSGPLSERRDVSAARVRPAPRPCLPPRGFERMGVAFSLVHFLLATKRKSPARRAGPAVKSLSAQRTSARQQRHDQESATWATTRDARRRALSSFVQQASASALLRPSLSAGGRHRTVLGAGFSLISVQPDQSRQPLRREPRGMAWARF